MLVFFFCKDIINFCKLVYREDSKENNKVQNNEEIDYRNLDHKNKFIRKL